MRSLGPNFAFHLVFTSFHIDFLLFLVSMKFEHRSTFDLGALRDFFSQITFLKSVHSKEKHEACIGFVVKIFTKSLHRGGVTWSF